MPHSPILNGKTPFPSADGGRYSALAILKNALRGHQHWPPAFRNAEPKKNYDIIIVGGGGHGLATAFYLAKNHGARDIAVLEKGYIGGGSAGRNTTIIRANYMLEGNTNFYAFSQELWRGLSDDLNFNLMYSPRGRLDLLHTPAEMDAMSRRGNIMKLNGVQTELLDINEIRKMEPLLDYSSLRFPIIGALYQPTAATARHDAVVWGFARAAQKLGVDIIQDCEVVGFVKGGGGDIVGAETTRGRISANKIGMAVAGDSSRVAQMAGIRLPIETHLLQAFVTEPIKPMLHHILGFGAVYFYISQSDHGGLVFGGDLDGYNSYARRGNLTSVMQTVSAAKSLLPCISRIKILRHWGGAVDMSMDGSPIIDKTHKEKLYFNGGWCYGGFKATPASGFCFAHLLANDSSHPLAAKFLMSRFRDGKTIDEKGRGPTPSAH